MKNTNWTKINGKPNLYKRNTPNGVEFMFKKAFTNPDGKYQQLYGYSSNEYGLSPKKEWEKKKADIEKNWDKTSKLNSNSSKLTINDIAPDYLKHSQSFKKNTYLRRKQNINKYILPALGNIKALKLSGRDIVSFYQTVTSEQTPKVTKEVDSVLNTMMVWMIDLGYISENPIPNTARTEFTRIIKQERQMQAITEPDKDRLDIRDVRKVLDYIKGHKDEIVYHWAIYHGCRPNEALGVDWSNIDLENKILHIRQGTGLSNSNLLKGTKYDDGNTATTIIVPLKNEGSVRDIPLQPNTIELLEKTPIEDRKGLVYTNKNDNPMDYANFNKRHVQLALNKLGITNKKYTFKSFRKFFCSYALNVDGIQLPLVSKWMGHTNITTTLQYYDKVLEGTGNNYIMSDLHVVETMPSAPTGYPPANPNAVINVHPQALSLEHAG